MTREKARLCMNYVKLNAAPWCPDLCGQRGVGKGKQEAFETENLHFSEPLDKVCVLVDSRVVLFYDPMDCSQPGFSVHGISQARILEWVAISFSKGSCQPRD